MPHRSLLLLLVLSAACTAPLVQDAGTTGPAVLASLRDARAAQTRTEDGLTLRGAFLDAGPDAPVVLHLLPTAASTETGVPAGIGRVALDGTLEALHALGWSSLVLDYRGVGRSDGRRNAARLRADGRAMWREAVRRAGGAPGRVVVRAASLGSLVAADLLARTDGSPDDRPAAALLIAPVRASTVVRNGARERHGSLAAWWAGATHASPNVPDLVAVVASERVPLLLVLAADDAYLPPEEAERVRDFARAAGHRVEVLDGDHSQAVLRAWGFEVDVDEFTGRRVPDLLDAERRFLDALELAPRP